MDKSKIQKLLILLDEAEQLVGQFTGGYSNRFIGAEEFHSALKISIQKLREGETTEIETLWIYFAPTCSWDDFVGLEGMELGNEIFELLDAIKKSEIKNHTS